MNTGLLQKSMREIWLVTTICSVGLFLFEWLVTYVFWTYQEEFTGDFMQIEFFSNLVNAMVGSKAGTTVGPATLQSLAWIHPLVLTLFFSQVITSTTRIPAGEIDSGTADVLLALPISRWSLYVHEAVVWLASGLVLITAAVLGNAVGSQFVPVDGRLPIDRILIVVTNLFTLYMVIGATACFLSTHANSRGRAVGGIVGFLLVVFLWNFLEQYWGPAEKIAFLNILSYYKPAPILDTGTIPWRDMVTLIVIALTLWGLGGRKFHQRDINTL
jgi:ABC-type transport system involved in multi-copper enzyme maturation permease subunit